MQANIDNAMFYLELVQKRRAQPQDDLFTKLIEADLEREDGGFDKLDDLEIAAFASLLGGAGAETVTKLVGNAVYLFGKNPDQWRKLQEDRSKIPAAVEELLRYEAPSQYNVRRNMRDVHLHGTTIPEGSPVFLIGGSANRDERAWTDADTFDIDRDRTEATEPRPGLRHPQLPWRCAGPHGECDRSGETARFHASLRGRLRQLQTRADAECRRLEARSREGFAMTQKIEVDFGLCESNGICMGIIPEVFDLDDEDYLHVLQDEVTPDNEQQVKEAVRQCPRQAISIREE